MTTTHNIKSGDDLIRARIDAELKERFDKWCATKKVTSSQILRWLIEMHLEDSNKLWVWLAAKEKDGDSNDSLS